MAKEAKTIVPLFQLKSVELQELTINNLAQGIPSFTNFNFEINVEANLDSNQKLVIAVTKVKIKADDLATMLGSITCACIFSVANFEEVITMKSNGVAGLYEPFAETINSISISTTRGVMFSELKGTILHYAFLPIIDIKGLSKVII
ncbi:MAG: hypothetical protein ACKVOQ_17290 [Cyclobacteriaceae bacterium]